MIFLHYYMSMINSRHIIAGMSPIAVGIKICGVFFDNMIAF